MSKKALITGGAGFIGSHLADALLAMGYEVTVLDVLHPQVHGPQQRVPDYLHTAVHLVQKDARDRVALQAVLEGVDVVFHFAAYTGMGQSMYQIEEYLDVNVGGTAVLLQLLSEIPQKAPKLIIASSRAVYGEGAYHCSRCGPVFPHLRTLQQLRDGHWQVHCPSCGRDTQPIPTPESKPVNPGSIYAASKVTQEQGSLITGTTYGVPVVVLRFFNVYGPRQSLQNPYTGVISTFLMRLVNGKPPQVYEDGRESRDFVHVKDVVQACVLAVEKEEANGRIFNVGTGRPLSMLQIAQLLAAEFGGPDPVITGQFRAGDIRHCYADIAKIRNVLGYEPQIRMETGLKELLQDVAGQPLADLSSLAEAELVKRNLAAKRDHSR